MSVSFEDTIFKVNENSFEEIALNLFRFQAHHNPVYSEYLERLSVKVQDVDHSSQIPCLPVEVFKYRDIKTGSWLEETFFESSGTSRQVPSRHYVKSLTWYHRVCKHCFEYHFGPIESYVFFALLPGYLERKHASLVNMVKSFVDVTDQSYEKQFFIREFHQLREILNSNFNGKKPLLFGVRFALLDFAEAYPGSYKGLTVIETGGMKGWRREISNLEFIEKIKNKMTGISLAAEYGMTELTAQAYGLEPERLKAPPFLKFSITHPTIPGVLLEKGSRGLLRIIDLSNIHTCAFLQTSDMACISDDGSLQILGRAEVAEQRGCALLYDRS